MDQKEKTDIKSLNLKELTVFMEQLGEKAFRAKQIYQWLHGKQAASFEEMTNIPKALIEKLKENSHLVSIKQEAVQISKIDGTRKYLFLLDDGNVIESVFMRYKHGNSVCISPQVDTVTFLWLIFNPFSSVRSSMNFNRLSKLSIGSPVPITTTLETRSPVSLPI